MKLKMENMKMGIEGCGWVGWRDHNIGHAFLERESLRGKKKGHHFYWIKACHGRRKGIIKSKKIEKKTQHNTTRSCSVLCYVSHLAKVCVSLRKLGLWLSCLFVENFHSTHLTLFPWRDYEKINNDPSTITLWVRFSISPFPYYYISFYPSLFFLPRKIKKESTKTLPNFHSTNFEFWWNENNLSGVFWNERKIRL